MKIRLKDELKGLAVKIRREKLEFKNDQRTIGNYNAYVNHGCGLEKIQLEFRHKHIAYCLLHGRTMEQIERKNRENNEPNQALINKYMEEYREEEIIHLDPA